MSNNRKNIRDAVKTLLIGNTLAGSNVYSNRETDLWESELPAILIYTKDETSQPRNNSGPQTIRTLNLIIDIKAEADASVDDSLDDIAKQVEDILAANPSLSATANSSIYQGTQITLNSDSDNEKGVASLTYEIKYFG